MLQQLTNGGMSACVAACVHTDMPAGHLVEHLGCTLRLIDSRSGGTGVGGLGVNGLRLLAWAQLGNDGGALAMATQP